MPIVPIQQWLRRFDRDEPLQKEHLLVAGLSPFRGDDGSPFELCGWCFASATEKHPVLLDAAGRPGSPSQALTSAVISHLQKEPVGAPEAAGLRVKGRPPRVLASATCSCCPTGPLASSRPRTLAAGPPCQRLVQKAARPAC